jgi:hypothetical protein
MSDSNITTLIDFQVTEPDKAGVYGWYIQNGDGGKTYVLVGKAISMSVGVRLKDYMEKDWFVDVPKSATPEATGSVFAEFVIKCLARLCQSQGQRLSVHRVGQSMEVAQKDQRAIALSQIAELQAWLDCMPATQSIPVRIDKKYKYPKWRLNQHLEAESMIRKKLIEDLF